MSSRRGWLLAVAAVLVGAAPAARAQVCPFCMRAQLQIQVEMQRQQTMARQAAASRFQQPAFNMRQDLTPRPFSQPGGRSFVPHAPHIGLQRTEGVRPVTRTVQGTRTQTHRTHWRIEEEWYPRGRHGHAHIMRRVREGSSLHTTVQRFTRQETHLERFTRDRLTVRPPSVTMRKQEPARFLQTTPHDRATVGKRGGETTRSERTPVDTHRPLVHLRVRLTATCGTCHSQPPAPTVVRQPAAPLPLPAAKPAAPSVVLGRRGAPTVVPVPVPGFAVGLPRRPLLGDLPPGLPPAVMRPAAGAPRFAVLAPPALPGFVLGLPRPALGRTTRAPGERSPGESEPASPGPSLTESAPPLPPLEGSLALAVPAGPAALRPAEKVAAAAPLLPEDVAQAPALPPLPGRSPLLIPAVPADAGAPPAGLLLAELVALAPDLPPLPAEAPPEATQRE
jgi:hypothetical protein